MEINVPSFFLITKGVLIISIKSMICNDSNIQIQSLLLSLSLRSIFLNRSLFNFPLLPTISKILHGSLLWDEFEISRVEDISLGYKGGLDRLDEDVAEKYDPSGVASGRTSQISDRYISLGMNCPWLQSVIIRSWDKRRDSCLFTNVTTGWITPVLDT